LFFIPHSVAGIPVFGPQGWAIMIGAALCVIGLALLIRRRGFDREVQGSLGVALLIGALIAFLLPQLEVRAPDGTILGVPIRGYGVMLLLGVLAGVGTAMHLARRVGLDTEIIISLAFWMFAAGIAGARLFFVIQYWEREVHKDTPWETLVEIVRFTEGGLVVYGALIGGMAAFIGFTVRYRLPTRLLADVIAPGMVIGLALGRIGCLFNGCCYGCTAPDFPLAIEFPRYTAPAQGLWSPSYAHQLRHGQLHGIRVDEIDGNLRVVELQPSSPAAASGIQTGVEIRRANGLRVETFEDFAAIIEHGGPEIQLQTTTGDLYQWTIHELPQKSLPVQPTQIYSSMNAFLLFFFLMALFPYRSRDGQVFAAALTLYCVTRFLLEAIRIDEPGQFGTQLTISQLVSLVTLAGAIVFWVYLARQPRLREAASA
jgi:phosphatidylglycerol:prolipoprotein diacylglycerol transferase